MKKQFNIKSAHFLTGIYCVVLTALFCFIFQKATHIYLPSMAWPVNDILNIALAIEFTFLSSFLQFHFTKKDAFGLAVAWLLVSAAFTTTILFIVGLSIEPSYNKWLLDAASSLLFNYLPVALLSSFIYYASLSLILKNR